MDFDFSDDQKLLRETARAYLAEHCPLALTREILETDKPYADALWKEVAQMGWQGAAIPEAYGGGGFGHLELAVLAEEIGRAVAPIPFDSSVFFATEALLLAGTEEQKRRYLPDLASGAAIGCFALAEGPGENGAEAVAAGVTQGKLSGTKLPVFDGDVATFAVVAAISAQGLSLYLADLDADRVRREPIRPFDPSRSMARLQFEGAAVEPLGPEGKGADLTDRLLDRAAVLMAFEQIGTATAALDRTREFVLGRYAFGRPVGSFQAIKHRMADLWCELELARSNAYYGAWALERDEDELDVAAPLARIQAGRALEQIAVEMLQLHGGVGFTWEYDCHLFYRRARLLSMALGSPPSWAEKLASRMRPDEVG